MNSIEYWAQRFLRDAFLFGTLFYWKVYEAEGIGDLFMAAIWAVNIVGLAALAIGHSSTAAKTAQNKPIGAFSYNMLSKIALFVLLAYFGLFFTAAVFYIACIGAQSLVTKPDAGEKRETSER